MWQKQHFDYFARTYSKPPDDQGAVGHSVARYLRELERVGIEAKWPKNHETLRDTTLSRQQVISLCEDEAVSDLVAYAVVMAWGKPRFRNFQFSISKTSLSHLEPILRRLRGSRRSRKQDFSDMAAAAQNIKGLKISFYTKLLFFFRASRDAYILDQFTAKSASVLLLEPSVAIGAAGMPHPSTTGEDYEKFCLSIETLSSQLNGLSRGWSPQLVEQAMFDKMRGQWRRYIATFFPKKKSSSRRARRLTNQSARQLYKVGITKNMRTVGTWFFPRKLADRLGSAGNLVIIHFPNGNRVRGRIGHSKGKFLNQARSPLKEFLAKHPKAKSFDIELGVQGAIQTLKIVI
jgi:hypothetical protein